MKILQNSDFLEIAERIENGQIGILPTDTVYGIVGVCSSSKIDLRNKIYDIKKRNLQKKLVLQIGLKYNILDIIENLDFRVEKIIKTFFPGSLTIILKVNKNFKSVYKWEEDTVGLRIPKNELLLKILDIIKKPLFVTSANISGDAKIYDFKKLLDVFSETVDFIVEETDEKSGVPSTIIDLSNNDIKFLREGEITKQKILDIWTSE